MKTAITLLLLSLCALGQSLPNHKLTPGEAAPITIEKLCSTKWGRDQRHVTAAMKGHVCDEYAAKNCPGKAWELDHLISRELGGADTEKNLWPQPFPEFHKKDRLENTLHKQVCSGQMKLKDAQQCLVRDWRACYQKTFGVSAK